MLWMHRPTTASSCATGIPILPVLSARRFASCFVQALTLPLSSTIDAVQAGDGNYFSVDGSLGVTLPAVGGLPGQPERHIESHIRFDGDASSTRSDFY